MSRIGRLPIPVPAGVEVSISGSDVTVKGPKGTLTHTVVHPISIEKSEDGTLQVTRPNDERIAKERHGLTRTLINNMIVGVTTGYTKVLEISGVGYRVVAKGSIFDAKASSARHATSRYGRPIRRASSAPSCRCRWLS